MNNARKRERWRPVIILGRVLRGYEVSDVGRVRSYRGSGGPRKEPRLRALIRHHGGFMMVGLQITPQRQQLFMVHELVVRAFRGPRPAGGLVVIHRNQKFMDNRLGNLEWVSRSQAVQHSLRFKPRRHKAKLTPRDIRAIRASKAPKRELTERYGVRVQNIYFICKRMTWKDVD